MKGVPGIGKSSLCKEIANYLYERNSFRDGIVYINANGIDTIEELLSNFEMMIDYPNKDLNVKKRTIARIATYLSENINSECLLIIDGLDQIYHREGKKLR